MQGYEMSILKKIIIISCLMMGLPVFSQNNIETTDTVIPIDQKNNRPQVKHQIGLALSSIHGTGINYQYLFHKDWRISTTGILYIDTAEDYGTSLFFSVGAALQRDLFKIYDDRNNIYRLYFYGGSSFDYEKYKEEDYNYNHYSHQYTEKSAALGVGMGFEFVLLGRLSGFFDIGYQYTDYLTKPKEFRLGLGGSIGAGFAF